MSLFFAACTIASVKAGFYELKKGDSVTDYVQKHDYAVVGFSTNTCGACKGMDEVLKSLSEGRDNIAFVYANLDVTGERKEAVKRYSITSYPLIIFFKHGKAIDKIEGSPMNSATYKEMISDKAYARFSTRKAELVPAQKECATKKRGHSRSRAKRHYKKTASRP